MYHLGTSLIQNSKLGIAISRSHISFSRNFCSALFKKTNNSELGLTSDKSFLNIMKRNETKVINNCLESKRIPRAIFISNSLFHNTCRLQSNGSIQDEEKRKNIIFILVILTVLAAFAGLSLNVVEHQDRVFIEYPDKNQAK